MSRRPVEQDIARQMRAAESARRRATITAGLIGGALMLGGGLLAWGWMSNPSVAEEKPSPSKLPERAVATETAGAITEPVTATVPQDPPPAKVVDPPPTTPPSVKDEPAADPPPKKPSLQRLSIGIGAAGYEPTVVRAAAGAPIRLTIAQGDGCAAGFLIPELGVSADNSSGDATVDLPALSAGTYRFTCGMEMVEGRLLVE